MVAAMCLQVANGTHSSTHLTRGCHFHKDAHRQGEGRTLVAKCPHLEAQDDGPDEAECQPVVPIHDVMGPHVLKMDSLLLQELKGLVHILQTVDAHSSLGGFRLETGEQKVETDHIKGQRQAQSYCPESAHACPYSTLLPKPRHLKNAGTRSVQGQYLPTILTREKFT